MKIFEFFQKLNHQNFRDQSKKHEQCPKKEPSIEMRSQVKVPHEKLDSCCGDEIFKFPFPSNGGKRACCGTRTFNTELLAKFENNFIENLKYYHEI